MFTFGIFATCAVLSFTGYGVERVIQGISCDHIDEEVHRESKGNSQMIHIRLLLANLRQASQPLPVSVYYESYCPDSIRFITQQVHPIMQMANFSLNIDLKLFPFGKASYTVIGGTYNFTCHHGEKECIGNKVQSCAIKYISSKKEQLDFIYCVMKEIGADSTQEYPTRKCGQNIHNIEQVETCASGLEGSQLLAANGNFTNALHPPLKSVPAVSVNNAERVDSDINLKAQLCQHLSTLNLTECANTSGSNQLASGCLAFLTAAVIFLLTRA